MAAGNKDYYKTLQVDPSAESEIIAAAYRRLALKYHPDTNKSPDATLRMQEINEAYGILSDPDKRAEYDKGRLSRASGWESEERTKTGEEQRRNEDLAEILRRRAEAEAKNRRKAAQAEANERQAETERRRKAHEAELFRQRADAEYRRKAAQAEANKRQQPAERERHRDEAGSAVLNRKRKQRVQKLTIAGLIITVTCLLALFLWTSASSSFDPTSRQSNVVLSIAPGIDMELVPVPSGPFLMGHPYADTSEQENEKPQHTVYLAGYLISRYEVTNKQFAQYRPGNSAFIVGREDSPVVNVSWYDALAFCDWLSKKTGRNVRLPTEAQWEKAARGTDGRLYPWGNQTPDATLLNFQKDVGTTTPVGRYSPIGDSPYGVSDMAGNVWQWTSTLYMPYPYRSDDGREDQTSPGARVVRGGAFDSNMDNVRSAYRNAAPPLFSGNDIGFRVVVLP